jgi:truncated hemoglobin YjbI
MSMVIEYIRYDVPEAQREGFVAAYDSAATDPLLAPVFATMSPAHAEHVADFFAEVFGVK